MITCMGLLFIAFSLCLLSKDKGMQVVGLIGGIGLTLVFWLLVLEITKNGAF